MVVSTGLRRLGFVIERALGGRPAKQQESNDRRGIDRGVLMGFGGGAVMSVGALDSVGRRGKFIYDSAARGGGI